MASITLNIPSPILNLPAGDKFKIRYQEYPGGVWSSYTDYFVQNPTIAGLTEGTTYRFEIIYVKDGTTECDPAYIIIDVVEPVTCLTFNPQLTNATCSPLFYLEINYTLPSPYIDPPCGHDITYTANGVTNTVNYSQLPISGQIQLSVPNASIALTITANLCNGEQEICYDDIIDPLEVPCIGITNLTGTLTADPMGAPNKYYIKVDFTQSCPATPVWQIQWRQTSFMFPIGTPPDSGSLSLPNSIGPQSNTSFSTVVFPNSYEGDLSYEFRILDICGTWHTLNLTL